MRKKKKYRIILLSQFKIKEKKVFDVVYDYIITSKFEEIRNKEVNEITTFKEIFVFFTKFIKFCDDEQKKSTEEKEQLLKSNSINIIWLERKTTSTN